MLTKRPVRVCLHRHQRNQRASNSLEHPPLAAKRAGPKTRQERVSIFQRVVASG
ncbi:hypothetical protein BD779DRAFT_1516468 [Infundibulicybe gibba]|nr:hypothetical protein BD779DRAFT_1516468 [Infundibulicybe gibba]